MLTQKNTQCIEPLIDLIEYSIVVYSAQAIVLTSIVVESIVVLVVYSIVVESIVVYSIVEAPEGLVLVPTITI